MKIKLLRITKEIEYNDDCADVVRHIVADYSDWEEVDQTGMSRLTDWVGRVNSESKRREDGYYLLASETEQGSHLVAIKEQIEYEEGERKRRAKEEKEYARQKKEAKRKKEEKKLARELKRLDELKDKVKQLEELAAKQS